MNPDYDEHMRRERRGAWIGLAVMIASFSIAATAIAWAIVGLRLLFA